MIKLIRGERPEALTDEVRQELTELYKNNRDKNVWNSPKIKKPLKEALLKMSHGKCVYCECLLDVESKDVTIDHFLPKTAYADQVVEWSNLLPSCLRCNRKKKDKIERIVNPCEDDPKEFLGLCFGNRFRMKGIDRDGIGKNTIRNIGLNDIERVVIPRQREWEAIRERLEEICEDIQEEGYKPKYKSRFENLMECCMIDRPYAAVKATNMLKDECYQFMKKYFVNKNEWTSELDDMEAEMERVSLKLVSFIK